MVIAVPGPSECHSSQKIMDPIEESVEATPSADNGNVPVDQAFPAAPVADPKETPASPAAPVEPATPAEPATAELFVLPDGREVDAATLAKEWKENFMPDYTRKSQELAKVTKPAETLPTDNNAVQKPYEDPTWSPKSYAELIAIAKEEMKGDLIAEETAKVEHQKAVETQVITQLNEVKTGYVDANGVKVPGDATLDENALFLHANKYKFTDLRLAHQNMKDMSETMKKVKNETARDISKRSDPVSVNPGAGGGQKQPASSFSNAVEFLRSIK